LPCLGTDRGNIHPGPTRKFAGAGRCIGFGAGLIWMGAASSRRFEAELLENHRPVKRFHYFNVFLLCR
jgi:hypothetical protein